MKYPNKNYISSNEHLIAYVDASPSELLHNSIDKYICVTAIAFFKTKVSNLKSISQFKNTRGLKRKLKTQDYIIDNIKNNNFKLYGFSSWNYRLIAIKNGKFILKHSGIVKDKKNNNDIVRLGENQLSYGHCVSLSWYSVVLSVFLKQIGQIAQSIDKKNVSLFLDLLSGDNIFNFKNLSAVRYIIDNSELNDFQLEAIERYDLKKIGFGYGIKNGTTKELKNDFEFVVTDWIAQSLHSLLIYEKENLDKESNEYKLSKLARFLVDDEKLKIWKNAIKLA